VLAPRAGPVALRRPGDPGLVLRVVAGLALVVLTGLFLYVTIGSALLAYADSGSSSTGTVGDAVQIESYLLLLAGAGLAWLAAVGLVGRRAAGLPSGSASRFGQLLLGSATTVFLPLVVCTSAYLVVVASGGAPVPNAPRQSVAVGLAAALSSGVGEEVFVVVAPVALLGPLVARAARISRGAGTAATLSLVVLMVAARLSYHLYYGAVVVVLLPWAVLTVLVYLRTRAVLPLMIMHVGYDAMLAIPDVGPLVTVAVAIGAAVAGARALTRARSRAAQPNSISTGA